jgi:hypothetical protein
MANEDPSFGGMGSADAISAAAAAISTMRQDMAAIERSSKGISRNMAEVSQVSQASGGGAGNTGSSKPVADGQGIGVGDITQAVGGAARVAAGVVTVGAGITGAMMPGVNPATGALAVAGFPDLRVGADRAMSYERSRLSYAFGTGGQFDQFRGNLEAAINEVNVQNAQVFEQQYAALVGSYGMSGGALGSRIMSDFGTLSVMAGVDQSQIVGAYNSMYGAPAYYAGLAMGVQTYDAQGNMMEPSAIVNQVWNTLTGGRGGNIPQEQLQRAMQPGSGVRRMIEQLAGGNQDVVAMVFRGLQTRQGQGGEALAEGQLDVAAEEAGFFGTDQTRALEAELGIEESRVRQTGEMTDDITSVVDTWLGAVEDTIDLYAEADGALRDMIGAAEKAYAVLDVMGTELPTATNAVTGAFGGLLSLLGGYVTGSIGGAAAGRAAASAAGGAAASAAGGAVARGAATRGGAAALARLGLGFLGGPVGAVATGVALAGAGAIYAWDRWLRPSPEEEARNVREGTAAAVESQEAAEAARQEAASSGSDLEQWIANNGQGTIGVPQYGDDSSNGFSTSGLSKGDWFVESDQITKIHYGEMVVPAQIAQAVRDELQMGKVSPLSSGRPDRGTTNVTINVQIQRGTDSEAMQFANKVKRIIDNDTELLAVGMGQF